MSGSRSIRGSILLVLAAAFVLLMTAAPALAGDVTGGSNPQGLEPLADGLNAPHFVYEPHEFVPESDGTPSGTQYRLFDEWGGTWYDAEKTPANTDDDDMCWAATAANMLRWAGWGYAAAPEGALSDEDEMFAHYLAHWEDQGSLTYIGLQWWLSGAVPDNYPDNPPYNGGPASWAEVDVAGGGGFWTGYPWSTYVHYNWTDDALQTIDSYLKNGWAVGLGIYDGGHAITCWGVNYDPDEADLHEKYKGVWVTDSDDDKGSNTPPDVLHYYEVDYHDNQWYLQGYGGNNWYIDVIVGLEPFPNTAPAADAGGPYSADEGTTINFNGSASTDADGNPLQYRWDFDSDGVWDTAWSESASTTYAYSDDYSGTVVVEVTDQMATVTDTAVVTVSNVVPSVNAGADQTVDEGDSVSFSGSFSDPGSADTHTIAWDFGDGTTGSATLTPNHTYGDNGVYTVTLTVTDDDGGVGSDTQVVTVDNVAPEIGAFGPYTVNENIIANVSATVSDAGSDDLTFVWQFQLGSSENTTYYNNGVSADPASSPSGTYPFSKTDGASHMYGDNGVYTLKLTVTDDDGGSDSYSTTVTVNNVAPTIVSAGFVQPNAEFILPVVHELTFSGRATDPGSDDLLVRWDWGDGSPDATKTFYNSGTSNDPYPSPTVNPRDVSSTAKHTYAAPGDYVVTLTITDDDGGSAFTTLMVHVGDVDEALTIFNDYLQSLPDSFYKNNAANRKASLSNIFSALQDMWADQEYQGMISAMNSNIRAKVDGLVGGRANDDWIVEDIATQTEICQKVDDITAYLLYLLAATP